MKGFLNTEILEVLKTSHKGKVSVIFIDRDGVINKRMPPHRHVLKWTDFEVLPGVYEALKLCNKNGIPTIIISNQRCLSLGTLTVKGLNEINDMMQKDFESHGAYVDGFFYCPHGEDDGCSCRKPKIGLFEETCHEFLKFSIEIDKKSSWMIGDEEKDIEAGDAFGLNTVFIGENDKCSNSKKCAKSLKNAIYMIMMEEAV